MLVILGSGADDIEEQIESEETSGRPIVLDIKALLTDVIPSLLGLQGKCIRLARCICVGHAKRSRFSRRSTQSDFPFLQGRSFVFASKFSGMLPSSMTAQYLSAALDVLERESTPIPVKVSAILATQK